MSSGFYGTLEVIKANALYAVHWVGETGRSFSASAKIFGSNASTAAAPYLRFLANKANDLWLIALPYLRTFYAFLQSPLGVSTVLAISAFVVLKLSEYSGSRAFRNALAVTAIMMAMASGVMLFASGLIPAHAVLIVSKIAVITYV